MAIYPINLAILFFTNHHMASENKVLYMHLQLTFIIFFPSPIISSLVESFILMVLAISSSMAPCSQILACGLNINFHLTNEIIGPHVFSFNYQNSNESFRGTNIFFGLEMVAQMVTTHPPLPIRPS